MSLILRPWQLEDADDLVSICNNKKVWNNVRDLMPYPYNKSDAKDFIEMTKTKNPLHNFCIEVDGDVVGNIGVVLFTDVYRKKIEIGYVMHEKYWGKGYATEAVRQMVDYSWKTFDVVKIFAGIFNFNKASMRVLEKNGFQLENINRKSVYKNEKFLDEYIFSLFRPGFLESLPSNSN